jgi:hypothetical protein
VYQKGRKRPTWASEIIVQRQKCFLGVFATPELAARDYDYMAIELFGDRVKLNFLEHRNVAEFLGSQPSTVGRQRVQC